MNGVASRKVKSQVVSLARMMLKVRLGLMGDDFGSRFDDSNYHLKVHSVGDKVRRAEINCWENM